MSTWNSAATTIQDAVDAASAGDEIVVTNGVYATGGRAVYGTMTNRVVVDKAVTVRSVNGPDCTWIVGLNIPVGNVAIRCVYLGSNAVLSGFTLTNGCTRATGDFTKEQNGGGVWCDTNAVVTNCTLIGNYAFNAAGGAWSGTLNNCTLSNNIANQQGAGAYNSVLNNCILSTNYSAGYGGGAASCTLNTCVLTGNRAQASGGGARNSLLNNCILSGNKAYASGTRTDGGGGANGGTLNHCILINNFATKSLGGRAFNSTLNNCSLSGNSAAAANLPIDLG